MCELIESTIYKLVSQTDGHQQSWTRDDFISACPAGKAKAAPTLDTAIGPFGFHRPGGVVLEADVLAQGCHRLALS